MMEDESRGIRKFESLVNFRDIGGLTTADGRRMRTGFLFRSDEPSKLNVRDIDRFKRLSLKLICDLRTPNERRSRIARFVDARSTEIVNVPFYQNDEDYTRFEIYKQLMKTVRTVDFYQMMLDFYRKVVFHSTGQVRTIMTLLADKGDAPALIHCASGKDRTGMIAALIQLLAGVPRHAVVQDYLLSNALNKDKTEQAVKWLRTFTLFRLSRQRIMPLLEVRREFLEEALDELFRRHESVENYFIQACGVEETKLERFKASLVVRY